MHRITFGSSIQREAETKPRVEAQGQGTQGQEVASQKSVRSFDNHPNQYERAVKPEVPSAAAKSLRIDQATDRDPQDRKAQVECAEYDEFFVRRHLQAPRHVDG